MAGTRLVRCVTKLCSGAIAPSAQVDTSPEGHWQFLCPTCRYWNLVASNGAVQATSQVAFVLQQLPASLRLSGPVKRSPPGGI
jgi:hypothetical protein